MTVKIFLYPNAPKHIHDVSKRFPNSVPLSEKSFQDKELVEQVKDIEKCDFFYMGMFSRMHRHILVNTKNWTYLNKFPEKHILDIEGDWKWQESSVSNPAYKDEGNHIIPAFIDKCIITINSPDIDRFSGKKIFVHPNSSAFLWSGILKKQISFTFPKQKSMFFRGKPDPYGTRERCKTAFNNIKVKGKCEIVKGFRGYAPPSSILVKSFEKDILEHSICLCPRGSGPDSVRFYEVCAYGRVPIIIGNNILPGEDIHDFSWLIRIDYRSSVKELANLFQKVYDMPQQELIERGKAAKNYFDTIIRPYYKDPTRTFFEWMKRQGLMQRHL